MEKHLHPRKEHTVLRKPKLLRPYRLLRLELGRMRRLYDACLYTFSSASLHLNMDLKTRNILPSTNIVVPNTDRVLARSPIELLRRMKDTYPEMLRASLLVRAVSHIENYFVDLLNEVASRNLTPFKLQDKKVSFSQAQLLSFNNVEQLRSHLIQSECRALNGKGFRDFEKYYKKRLNITFSQGPVSVDEIDGIYARRHLLVHAGGVIDEQFQKRFAAEAPPGEVLKIPEDYFLEALKNLQTLAEYCAIRVEVLFPKSDEPVLSYVAKFIDEFQEQLSSAAQEVDSESSMLITWFSGAFQTTEFLEAHFSDESTFNIEGVPYRLSRILVGRKRISEQAIQWLVCGEKVVVGQYIAYLMYLTRQGILGEFEKQTVSGPTVLS